MKSYIIYLNLELDCPDKCSRATAQAARVKALATAKEQFLKVIKNHFQENEIVIKKEQPILDAVAIEINEDDLYKLIQKLIKMDLVQTIDSLCPISIEEPKEKTFKIK